jgi:hypothetical protein
MVAFTQWSASVTSHACKGNSTDDIGGRISGLMLLDLGGRRTKSE